MKAIFDKAFENLVRLRIMSVLMVNDSYDFNSFKELLDVTDGNLASHLKQLENQQYIEVKKSFLGRKTHTSYVATELGAHAFKMHIAFLEKLIQQNKP